MGSMAMWQGRCFTGPSLTMTFRQRQSIEINSTCASIMGPWPGKDEVLVGRK